MSTETRHQVSHRDLDVLARHIRGEVIRPPDPRYDQARRVWNGSIDRRPAAIVRCRDVRDVKRGLAFAVERGLVVAVRAGGHNVAGFGTCDGGVVLDLRPMASVSVDPARRLAVVGPGAVGAEFDRQAQEHGLATTLGIMSTTGVAGLTLGGGIGWLQRAFGLACDNLVAADLLTAEGRIVRACSRENQDLLWGLRGGGGNFGIVTSFEFRLHRVGPRVLCGLVVWPADQARDVLRLFREFAPEADDALTVIAVCRTAPRVPFLPAELYGRPIIALAACYAGPIEEGQAALAPLRAFGQPAADALTIRSYADFQAMFDASWEPGFCNYWKAEYLANLDDDIVDVLARYAVSHTSPLSDFKIATMGGAVARVGEAETAYSHRHAPFVLNVNTRWVDPAQSPLHTAHTHALFEEAQTASAGGVYVNFLGDEGHSRVQHAYGSKTFARLQALKRRWDPDNIFRVNQNIPPES
ncbi:MAG TPA: FAD-binding oxidoreductase [Egibacteraceae bacterium]|jgi:FAD/FMN-containing dehydrogenase|nr:FAD-binding oxidoreductase [Egibacteraceae bacterium]